MAHFFRLLLTWITGFFSYLYGILKMILVWFWIMIYNQISPFIDYLITQINVLLGTLGIGDVSVLKDFWATADQWLPLTEYLVISQLFFAFWGIVVATKWVLRLVPGLSA